MAFLEYINRQLNPTGDAAMQAAMNWGLAPGFPGVTATPTPSGKPSEALKVFQPRQQRQAANKGRRYLPKQQQKQPSKGIPTLPNRPIQRPVVAQQPQLKPIGPAQMDTRTELPSGPPLAELPDIAQYFAPPMTPMFDNGQGQGVAELPPFGLNAQDVGPGLPMEAPPAVPVEAAPMPDFGGGLPITYADLPMPEMSQISDGAEAPLGWPGVPWTKNLPIKQSPIQLTGGLGKNVSPYGVIDLTLRQDREAPLATALNKGKQGFIPQEQLNTQQYGFIHPASVLPMQFAESPTVALGGGVEEDITPMQAARHAYDDELAVLEQQQQAMQQEMRRRQNAYAMGMLFGGRQFPQAMNSNAAMYNQFLMGQAARRQAALQQYQHAQQMYDENTIPNKTALGNLDVNKRNATTNEGRLADSQARTGIQRGQLDRQIAADRHRAENDAALLNQRQAEGIARQSDNAQAAMVKAMLGQQASKDKAADRASREGIARGNRDAANSRAASHDKTMQELFGRKTKAGVDTQFRKQVLDFQAKLSKNDKRLDVGSMLDTMSGRMPKDVAQRIAVEQAALPSWKAQTEEGRMRMLANAFANALVEETSEGENSIDGDEE